MNEEASPKWWDGNLNRTLRRAGWRVLRIWECELVKLPEACVCRIQRALA